MQIATTPGIKTSRENVSILVANDGTEIWAHVGSVLEDCGYAVETITEGRDGLDKIASLRPDLVIVGEDLADISGIDWIIRVRQLDPGVRLSFVSNTWRNTEFYQRLKKDFAVSLVVHRPFKPSLFTLQIETLFGHTTTFDTQHLAEMETFERHQSLKMRYAAILPLRLQQLGDSIKKSRMLPNNVNLVSETMRLAHNMKGCARSCGFQLIGDSAEFLEKCLTNILNKMDGELYWSKLESRFELMQKQFNFLESKYGGEADLAAENHQDDASKAKVLFVSNQLESNIICDKGLLLQQASDFHIALEQANKKNIDAVLIDLALDSRQAAFDFADSIREIDGLENLPLGFVSSGLNGDDQLEATRAGGSLFLEKRPDAAELLRAANFLCNIRQGGRPRILLVDDDPDLCQVFSSFLAGEGMMVDVLHDPSNIMNKLEEYSPDLILLDVMMPVINGYDVCRQLRSMSRWQDVPIIILTAHSGPDARINAFEAGADDYLPKPIIETEFLARIRTRLERAKLLKDRTDRDTLTGLLSRRAFNEHLAALLSESSRHHFNFCLGFIDVDHFKQINDLHGHQVGDKVLSYLGALFQRRFRVEDLRSRWGGEEFALAFPHANSSVMRNALTRVLQEFSVHNFENEQGKLFNVTFSAGMVTFPDDGNTMKDLLLRADERLYLAKSSGRNTIVISE